MRRFISLVKLNREAAERQAQKRCTDEEERKSKINWWNPINWNWTALATCIIAGFTILIYCIGVNQWRTFQGQLAVMQGQLDAMKADQRPLVFATNIIISHPIVHDEKGLNIALRFDLKNGGHSPALQTSARFRAYLRSLNFRTEEGVVCKDAEPPEFGITLFADTPISLETGWLIPTQEIEASMKLGAAIVPFIVACVAYQFPGTREYHTTPYEFIISPAVGSTKWPCCSFPIDDKEIQPPDLQLILVPVASPD